jgi:hypothetical protein
MQSRFGNVLWGTVAAAFALCFGGCTSSGPEHAPHAGPSLLGTSLNAWDDDKPRKESLEQQGVAFEGRHVVAWFPRVAASPADSLNASAPPSRPLTDADRRAIVERLDRGIAEAKRFIGKPDWSFRGDPRLYFYFPDANFISHAPGGNTAFIPLWRIHDDQAPWLHEAMHLLIKVDGDWLSQPDGVAEARMPLWLHEGLAEAISMEVDARTGMMHYSPLIDVPADQLDAFAVSRVRECPDPQRLLAYIGGRGKLPELFGEDRMKYAAAFYASSTSFVRCLARRDGGYQHLLAGIAAFDREAETYEHLSGQSLGTSKEHWTTAIGLDAAPPTKTPPK